MEFEDALRVVRVRKTILHKSVYWFEIQRSGRKESETTRCRGGDGRGAARGRAKAGGKRREASVIKRAVNEARISLGEGGNGHRYNVTAFFDFKGVETRSEGGRGPGVAAYAILGRRLRYRGTRESESSNLSVLRERSRSITEQKRLFWNKLNAQLNLWMRHARGSSWYRVTSSRYTRPELVFLPFLLFFSKRAFDLRLVSISTAVRIIARNELSTLLYSICVIRYERRLLDSSLLSANVASAERIYIYPSLIKRPC